MQANQCHFLALGGLDENGNNLYCFELNNKIYLLEGGSGVSSDEFFGINVEIPDFTYLEKNRQKLQAIFVSKPSENFVEAVPYLLQKFKIPVYTSYLGSLLIENALKRHKFGYKFKSYIRILKARQKIKLDEGLELEVFSTTTSMPDSYGFAFFTPLGSIIYTGSYIFDQKADPLYTTEMKHLASIAKKQPVLALINDASTASRGGYSSPHHYLKPWIHKLKQYDIKSNRFLLFAFAQDIHRIQEFLSMFSQKQRITAFIYNEGLFAVFSYLQLKYKILSHVRLTNDPQTPAQVVVVSGSQQELNNHINNIAIEADDVITLEENDYIVLANPPQAGTELNYAHWIDEMSRANGTIISINSNQCYTITPSYEDIKMMCSIMQPKYFIPVSGLYKDFVWAQKAAIEAGLKDSHCLILNNGQKVSFNQTGHFRLHPTFNLKKQIVGDNLSTTENSILWERKKLAQNGVLIVGLAVDAKTKTLASLIDIQMRGVVYIRKSDNFVATLRSLVEKIVQQSAEEYQVEKVFNSKELINKIKKVLKEAVKAEIAGRNSIILVSLNEI